MKTLATKLTGSIWCFLGHNLFRIEPDEERENCLPISNQEISRSLAHGAVTLDASLVHMPGLDLLYIDAELAADAKQSQPKEAIYEWYAWSYFNVIFGCLLMGFIGIIFSLRTTMHKQAENRSKARLWSRLTLLWNIFGTTAGITLVLYAALKQ